MALMHIDFYSQVLNLCMNMDVILPQRTHKLPNIDRNLVDGKFKTMYLLHGMTEDHTIWQRRTSIERYADNLGIAVVMPSTHLGFYTDTTYGMNYWTFISKELPKVCREFFPQLSERREDTLAAGLSMGGYGAWKLALGASDTFSAAASLSGALDIAADIKQHMDSHQQVVALFKGIFGSMEALQNSDNNLLSLAERLAGQGKELPRLYAWCGTEDFLYQTNLSAWEHVKKLGYDLTYKSSPGDHQWQYWDTQIQDALKWWLDNF